MVSYGWENVGKEAARREQEHNLRHSVDGTITRATEYVVHCINCSEMASGHQFTRREFEKHIRAVGWQCKVGEWHCPICIQHGWPPHRRAA